KTADIGHPGACVARVIKEPPGGGQNGKDRWVPGDASGLTRADNVRGHQGILSRQPGPGLPSRSWHSVAVDMTRRISANAPGPDGQAAPRIVAMPDNSGNRSRKARKAALAFRP